MSDETNKIDQSLQGLVDHFGNPVVLLKQELGS